ncbi:MAG: hypothetical protein GF308_06990 [Candidatus Heimdallarchaeota archaeon]|nr:hypothetical protein [Candidatus Heimdallarchaeota archaeon]
MAKNELIALVEAAVPLRILGVGGATCKELAQELDRAPPHIAQVLTKLCTQGVIAYSEEKRNVQKTARVYYRLPSQQIAATEQSSGTTKTTCGNCQRYSGLHRCILLDLAAEEAPWVLPEELQERQAQETLARNTPACPYYDRRVDGHCKSKTMTAFIKLNTEPDSFAFHCPIARCNQVIAAFSFPLQPLKLGATTFYCPHCGSPMAFKYNAGRKRYEVQYWDARFDILQQDYFTLTGLDLPARPQVSGSFGVSIGEPQSFYLDLRKEVLYVGSDLSPTELRPSKDQTYFPLRHLTYIATTDAEDYTYLLKNLHATIPGTKGERKLYGTITLLPPRKRLESPSPTPKEEGGNELIIASELVNPLCLRANLTTRETVLRKKAYEDENGKENERFHRALIRLKRVTSGYCPLQHVTARQWQQYEGGCGSIMVSAFKAEARKHGFRAPPRVLARMVRGEPFLPYGYYYARAPYHALLNGVNHVIISQLKEEIYQKIPLAWEGLRGWCHQGYPQGLLYDQSEVAKMVGQLCAHQAIQEGRIGPDDFVQRRGKRYENYYCVEPDSETEAIIREIGQETLRLKVGLANGQTMSLSQAYENTLRQLKRLLNTVAQQSASQLFAEEAPEGKIMTLWKKIQQTNKKEFLTRKERQQLKEFMESFFSEQFKFEPLMIVEVY